MDKNNLQHLLIISIFLFMISNCSQNYYTNKDKIDKSYNIYKNQNKIKNNKNYYSKYPKTLYSHENLIQTNKTIHFLIPRYFSSEIQINESSINLLNIFLKDEKQLIFNQVGLHLLNEKIIYNFGVGYRKNFYNQWIIGNNIFFDTISSKYDKKILSIGNEFLTKSTYITNNIYHCIFINNPIYIQHKKYIPYTYDIYIKKNLQFFPKISGTINLEHHFHIKKYNNTIPQNIYNTKKSPFYIPKKLILGIIYTPGSLFTFTINKTILNSLKTYEIKFSVAANYKINIPWIYQIKNTNNKKNYYKKIYLLNNNTSIIARNNKIFFNHNFDQKDEINIFDITHDYLKEIELLRKDIIPKKNISYQNHKTKNQQSIQNKKIDTYNSLDKYYLVQVLKSSNNYTDNKNTCISNFDRNTSLNQKISTTTTENSYTQSQSYLNDETNTFNQNDKSPHTKKITSNNSINNIHNLKINPTIQQKSKLHSSEKLNTEEIEIHYHDNVHYSIPPPPPISKFLIMNDVVENNDQTNYENYTHTNNENNSENNIEKINQHKYKNFSSIGTEEHLSKLNDITKKRKKTTSISSSTDSNDSESTTLLKIIERQSALGINNDTDSDEKNSLTSNNEFSE